MVIGRSQATQLYLRPIVPPRSMHPRLFRARPTIPIQLQILSSRNTRPFTISRQQFAAATATTPTTPIQPTLDPSTTSPNPPPPRRRRRGIYYGTFFLAIGLTFGTLIRLALQPPSLPAPDSPEDIYLTSKIRERGASLPLVRSLSSDPSWTSWDAYSDLQPSPSQPLNLIKSRITSGPLGGARGLAFQRVFWNAATGEVLSVVYFGPGTSGWPGVVHGGALATVLDESLGRCAILRFPARTGVTARLELTYRAPTLTAGYYVVRARPMPREGDDPAKSDRKMWIEGTLESLEGRVCVEAKALFVVPKGVKLKPFVEGF